MSYRWTPKVDCLVELHYAKRRRKYFGRHLQVGVVRCAPGPGRGPRNYLVEMKNGERLIVPNGQIFPQTTRQRPEQGLLFSG